MKISQRIVGIWTSRLAMAVVAVGLALATVAQDVEAARRLGGGKSFGRQSQNVERQQMQPPAGQPAQAGPVQQAGQPAAAGAAAQSERIAPAAAPRLAFLMAVSAITAHVPAGCPALYQIGRGVMAPLRARAAVVAAFSFDGENG